PDQSRLEVKSNRAHLAGRRPAMMPKTNTSRAGAAGRIVAGKYWSAPRPYLQVVICKALFASPHLDVFDAVALFSMFTTWTRRFTSAIGWLGSLSLLLPYPTVTRSVPLMPYLSTR